MSFSGLLVHQVTIYTMGPGTEDRYGNAALERIDAGTTVRARVEMIDTSEVILNREEQRERFRIFLPATAVVAGGDELEWLDAGITLQAEGAPRLMTGGAGVHHYELTAYRITG